MTDTLDPSFAIEMTRAQKQRFEAFCKHLCLDLSQNSGKDIDIWPEMAARIVLIDDDPGQPKDEPEAVPAQSLGYSND